MDDTTRDAASAASHGAEGVARAVVSLVEPILADLGLELYDCEFAGGVLRVTIDTPPGGPAGVDLDQIALVTRLLGREMDHPADGREIIPGRYTLEVSSPGLERRLRTPGHFAREVGKEISVRFASPVDGRRRVTGVLVSADADAALVRTELAAAELLLDTEVVSASSGKVIHRVIARKRN
jgi:ribosome maturation factor RimP